MARGPYTDLAREKRFLGIMMLGVVLVFIGVDMATFGICTLSGCIPPELFVGLTLAFGGVVLILIGVAMWARGREGRMDSP